MPWQIILSPSVSLFCSKKTEWQDLLTVCDEVKFLGVCLRLTQKKHIENIATQCEKVINEM